MTNIEFQEKLRQMYEDNPMIARSKKKTVNEIFYLLRMDKENDYCISMVEDCVWSCIPSVKETFVPVKSLARHVKSIVCDDEEENPGCAEICLTIVTEK